VKKSKCKTHVVPVSKCSKGVAMDSFCIYQDNILSVHLESESETQKIVSVSVSIHED